MIELFNLITMKKIISDSLKKIILTSNSIESLKEFLISKSPSLKNRSYFLFTFFNKKQTAFEVEYEKLFFSCLINHYHLHESQKYSIESFYLKHFSYKNFRKLIKKDVRTKYLILMTSIMINSEIIFDEIISTINHDNVENFMYIFTKLFMFDAYTINFENKKLAEHFLKHIISLSPESIHKLSSSESIKQLVLIPIEKMKINNQLENF